MDDTETQTAPMAAPTPPGPDEWLAYARREAAALLTVKWRTLVTYDDLVHVTALAWMQGAIYATHIDLAALEQGVHADA